MEFKVKISRPRRSWKVQEKYYEVLEFYRLRLIVFN